MSGRGARTENSSFPELAPNWRHSATNGMEIFLLLRYLSVTLANRPNLREVTSSCGVMTDHLGARHLW